MNARQVPTTVIQRMNFALTLTLTFDMFFQRRIRIEMVQVVEVNSKDEIQS